MADKRKVNAYFKARKKVKEMMYYNVGVKKEMDKRNYISI